MSADRMGIVVLAVLDPASRRRLGVILRFDDHEFVIADEQARELRDDLTTALAKGER